MNEFRIAVYSDNARTRRHVLSAIGTGGDASTRIHCVEVATAAALQQRMAAGEADLAVLDAEATPVGGLGLARQLKDEIDYCPPLIVLIRRSSDTWLARWSRADAAVAQPIGPLYLARAAMKLMKTNQVK